MYIDQRFLCTPAYGTSYTTGWVFIYIINAIWIPHNVFHPAVTVSRPGRFTITNDTCSPALEDKNSASYMSLRSIVVSGVSSVTTCMSHVLHVHVHEKSASIWPISYVAHGSNFVYMLFDSAWVSVPIRSQCQPCKCRLSNAKRHVHVWQHTRQLRAGVSVVASSSYEREYTMYIWRQHLMCLPRFYVQKKHRHYYRPVIVTWRSWRVANILR